MSFTTHTTSKAATARAVSLEHKAVRSHRRFLRLRKLVKLLDRLGMVSTARRVDHYADAMLDYGIQCSFMAEHYLHEGDVRHVVEHAGQERLIAHLATRS